MFLVANLLVLIYCQHIIVILLTMVVFMFNNLLKWICIYSEPSLILYYLLFCNACKRRNLVLFYCFTIPRVPELHNPSHRFMALCVMVRNSTGSLPGACVIIIQLHTYSAYIDINKYSLASLPTNYKNSSIHKYYIINKNYGMNYNTTTILINQFITATNLPR